MCGICGYFSDKTVLPETLEQMNDTMIHRGPDDSGIWQERTGSGEVGLAQRRLSILDLSDLGHQPMFSEDKNIAVVYNGEVYNYRQLKKELIQRGYGFRSQCDTEVVLAAYQEWGTGCFRKLNGMFAIALYDRKQERLVLARDRMGKKPLYYYKKGKDFVFASELKPIMGYPYFEKCVEKNMIEKFLCNKYIEAPYSIFKNTFKMVPGTYLIYEKGEAKTDIYWDIREKKENAERRQKNDIEEAASELEELLQDSIRSRLIADVPAGVFLSGGIDSTLVSALAQQAAGGKMKSFSIGFYDKERNEAEYAAEIAKYIGTEHKELYIGEREILNMLDNISYYYDEPFSDSSQLPMMLLSRMASEDITVALSGDGGDELYCGYKMYDWTWIAQHTDWIGGLASQIPGMQRIEKILPIEMRAFLDNRDNGYKVQLFTNVMIEEADRLLGINGRNIKFERERELTYKNWQERRMLLDMLTYLPDEVLAKTDRASMKYSIEVRCPLLDYRIVEQSFCIPHKFKYANGNKKYILKKLAYKYVPEKLLKRPKMGFGVPLKKWLRTTLKPEIEKYADKQALKKQGIFVPEAVEELIGKQERSNRVMYSSMLWSFYIFQRWYQTYIEDLWKSFA